MKNKRGIVTAVVAAVVIAGLLAWMLRRQGDTPGTLDEKFADAESPFYELIADGELAHVVVAIHVTEQDSMWIRDAALLFVDLETSGLDPKEAAILSIGAIIEVGTTKGNKIYNEFYGVVLPTEEQ